MASSAERMRRLRARRAAGLLPGGAGRDPDCLLAPAVESSVAALGLGALGAAAAAIARDYAAAIDEASDHGLALARLGPLLLDCLRALGATPASRSKMKTGKAPAGPSRLDQMRAARRA